jgi:integrase/recombinase XerD
MVEAMLFGGLRRCEVLGLRLADVNIGERRLFITEGKGDRQWIVPISSRFFATLGAYIDEERPRSSATERLFVVLKRPRRGWPLSADGLDEILEGDCAGAGLPHLSCHQLRHACFTRLREARRWRPFRPKPGMHRSMSSGTTGSASMAIPVTMGPGLKCADR